MGIDKCECGERLPTNLLGLGSSKFEHVCSCERAYREVDGKFVPNGTQHNPFADHDSYSLVDKKGTTE